MRMRSDSASSLRSVHIACDELSPLCLGDFCLKLALLYARRAPAAPMPRQRQPHPARNLGRLADEC